ncbi:MAG: SprT-like domain-containing protein [Steroidobacteraceae bacterium]
MKLDGNKRCAGLFTKELRAWGHLWRVPALGSLVTVAPNFRLRTTLARYVLKARTIELGPAFFRLRRRRLAVLCHEAAHAAVAIKFNLAEQPHGPIWVSLVEAAGYPARSTWAVPRRRVTSKRAHVGNVRKRLVYEHRCPVCQFRRLAGRPVRVWRCPECSAAGLPAVLTVTRKEMVPEIR